MMIEKIRRFSRRAWVQAARARVALGDLWHSAIECPVVTGLLILAIIMISTTLALSVAQYGRPAVITPAITVQTLGDVGGVGSVRGAIEGPNVDAIKSALGQSGRTWFVKPAGSDLKTGESWREAFATLQHAIDVAADGNGDTIFLASGVYDGDGVVVNKSLLSIIGMGFQTDLVNTDTTDGSFVVRVVSDSIKIANLRIIKAEATSLDAIYLYVDDADFVLVQDVIVGMANAASHTGILVENGNGFRYINTAPFQAGLTGISGLGVGTGVVISNSIRAAIAENAIGALDVCVQYTGSSAPTAWSPASSLLLTDCTIPVQFDPGTQHNSVGASITDSGPVVDNSGYDNNVIYRDSLTGVYDAVIHRGIPSPCDTIVVDGVDGRDTNNGQSSAEAVRTLQRAAGLVTNGGCIAIQTDGQYTGSWTLATSAVQIWSVQGVGISATNGITLAGNNIWWRGPAEIVAGTDSPGVRVAGANIWVESTNVTRASVAYLVTGENARLLDTRASGYAERGYEVQAQTVDIVAALASGGAAPVSGFVFTGTTASRIEDAVSVGNLSAGFVFSTTTANNMVLNCTNSSDSGDRVDLGERNMFANWVDQMETEPHRHIFPISDGEGGAGAEVTVDQQTEGATNQDYWGDTVVIIPSGAITDRYKVLGAEFVGGAQTSGDLQWQMFFVQPAVTTARNGGNAWNTGVVRLTVVDNSFFEIGDYAWMRSDAVPDGEIVIVAGLDAGGIITITTEARASAGTGTRYNHGSAGAELGLAWREDDDRYHPFDGSISLANRVKANVNFPESRVVDAAVIVARSLNGSSAVNGPFGMRVIYE